MPPTDRDAMVRFSCPKCDRQMQARTEYTGRLTRCPGCQHQLAIPDLTTGDKATPLRLPSGGRRGPLAILAVVVLVAALGGALAAWRLWPRDKGGPTIRLEDYVMAEVDDLALLPA